MKKKKISGLLLALAMTVSSSFTAFALPATCNGTMPNDIEIKNGDGTDVVQTTLGEAFGTAILRRRESTNGIGWIMAFLGVCRIALLT